MKLTGKNNIFSWFAGLISSQRRLEKGEHIRGDTDMRLPDGKPMKVESSLRISTVWGCIRHISSTISTLKLELINKSDNKIVSHQLSSLFACSPNADMTMIEFMEGLVVSLLLYGNSYSAIKRDKAGNVISLEPLNSEAMTVARSDNGAIAYILNQSTKVAHVYDERDIFHIKGLSLDGLIGLSPIREGGDFIGLQVAANEAARQGYANSLKAGGIIQTGQNVLSEEQRDTFRKYLATFSNPENINKFLVLEAGMTVAQSGFSMSHADAQLLESRNFGIEEICRLYGMPPPLIGHTNKASSWASSSEEMNMQYLTYTIRPILVKIEQAISKKLLTAADRMNIAPKFNVESLLRADSKTRGQYYRDMADIFTRNEIRAAEGLPPIKGGDILLAPLNMTRIEDIGNE